MMGYRKRSFFHDNNYGDFRKRTHTWPVSFSRLAGWLTTRYGDWSAPEKPEQEASHKNN
jgi:hypothetical protein